MVWIKKGIVVIAVACGLLSATAWATEDATVVSASETTNTPDVTTEVIPVGTGDMVIRIEGLKNTNGYVHILLFNSAADYPIHPENALRIHTLEFKSTTIEYRIKRIPYGYYALAVTHDENANYDFDLGFLGIPLEGVSASNGAKGFFGPPKWKDARILMDQPVFQMNLKMHYGISYWI